MERDIPTYLPGDTIMLRLEIQHEVNLTDVWAIFRKEEEVTTLAHFQFSARLRNLKYLRPLRWSGIQRTSEVFLEAQVTENEQLAGVYELVEVRGLPFGESRQERNVVAFDVPADVRFQIAYPPAEHVPRVTRWELSIPTLETSIDSNELL